MFHVIEVLLGCMLCLRRGDSVCCRRAAGLHESFSACNHGHDVAIDIDPPIDKCLTEHGGRFLAEIEARTIREYEIQGLTAIRSNFLYELLDPVADGFAADLVGR